MTYNIYHLLDDEEGNLPPIILEEHNPDLLKSLPEDITTIETIISAAASEGAAIDRNVRAAHVYARRQAINSDALGSARNDSYGKDDDDIVIQVSYVITKRESPEIYAALKNLDDKLTLKQETKLIEEAEDRKNAALLALKEAEQELEELRNHTN